MSMMSELSCADFQVDLKQGISLKINMSLNLSAHVDKIPAEVLIKDGVIRVHVTNAVVSIDGEQSASNSESRQHVSNCLQVFLEKHRQELNLRAVYIETSAPILSLVLSGVTKPVPPNTPELISVSATFTWCEHVRDSHWDLLSLVQQVPLARQLSGLLERAFPRLLTEGLLRLPALQHILNGQWQQRQKALTPLLDHISTSLANLSSGHAACDIRKALETLDQRLFPPTKFKPSLGSLPQEMPADADEDLQSMAMYEVVEQVIVEFPPSSSPPARFPPSSPTPVSELSIVEFSSEPDIIAFDDEIGWSPKRARYFKDDRDLIQWHEADDEQRG